MTAILSPDGLYRYRLERDLGSTDPRALWSAADPVDPDNDHHLEQIARGRIDVGLPGPMRLAA